MASNKQVVEYEAKLKDGISNPLGKATKAAHGLDNAMSGVGKSASQTGSVFAGMLRYNVFETLASGAWDFAKSIVAGGAKLEQTRIAFQVLTGSVEEGNKQLRILQQFSDVTPFTIDQVQKAGKTLLSFGVAAKDVAPTLKVLGDVSAGTGKDLSELGVIYGQIKGAGKLMGQDLLQLINAGFNPLQQISKTTGKSMGQLKDEMSKGRISFGMVQQAFIDATSEGGLFNDMMEKQSKTLAGRWSTLSGQFVSSMADMGEALAPFLTKFINGLIVVFNFIKNNIPLFRDLAIGIGVVAAAWGAYVIATKIATIATWSLTAAFAANPIGMIIAGVTLLIAGMVTLWHKVDAVREVFWGLWGVIKQFGTNIKNFVVDIFSPFITAFNQIKEGNLKGAAISLGKGALGAAGSVGKLYKLGEGLGDAYSRGAEGERRRTAGNAAAKAMAGRVEGSGLNIDPLQAETAGAMAAAGGKDAASSVGSVKSGRPTNINISIEKLIETFNIVMEEAQATEEEMKELVSRTLVSAVNDVNLLAK